MINRISFTVKGDYDELTFRRSEDSPNCEINFHRHSGMSIARFLFADLRKALNVLNSGAKWLETCQEYADHGFDSLDWRPDTCFCSRCGHGFSMIDNCTEEFNFCPNCGAEVDG